VIVLFYVLLNYSWDSFFFFCLGKNQPVVVHSTSVSSSVVGSHLGCFGFSLSHVCTGLAWDSCRKTLRDGASPSLWSLLWDFLLFCMALKVISPATFDQNMISITTARLVQERKWKHKKKEMGNWAPCRLCLRLSLFPVSSCFRLLLSVLR
jgi:hypothetical protein